MTAFPTGPYINGAFLCERVLTEQDGVNTYVRVVDRFTRGLISPERVQLGPLPVELTLVLLLKPGEARGAFEIALDIEKPSGERRTAQEFNVNFPGGQAGGVNAHVDLNLQLDQPGLWWIDVLGGPQRRLMTRVSAELIDQWIRSATPPGPTA